MPVSQLWAVLFFLMMLCLGLDSEVVGRAAVFPRRCAMQPVTCRVALFQFAMVEVAVTSLTDQFGTRVMQHFKRKELLVLAVCAVAFLLGIPCVMQVEIHQKEMKACEVIISQTVSLSRSGSTSSS